MNCEYCQRPVEKDRHACPNCGAIIGLQPRKEESEIVRCQPFHYNGYVVWGFANYFSEMATYQFWLGDEVIETIELSREMIRQFVPEGMDSIAFVWELFELTQGEEEVLRISQQNYKGRHPATFDIRYVPTEREEYASGITKHGLSQAVHAGERVFVF